MGSLFDVSLKKKFMFILHVHINPRLPLKWLFGVQFPGSLLCAVVRVINRNFLSLLRGTSLRLLYEKIFEITCQ